MSETETSPIPAADNAPAREAKPLDEVLLAMDVVDTLRHREQLVARELDSIGREEELIERLREIYTAQGIEVPDHILKDGVKALEEQRFLYKPPKSSLSVRIAKIYISRGKWMKPLIGGVAALGIGAGVYQFGYVMPAAAKAKNAAIELSTTIPTQLSELNTIIQDKSPDDVDRIAESYYQTGMQAIADEDADEARDAVNLLETLQRDLTVTYDVRVNSDESGTFRIHPDDPNLTNYYLIVEAIDVRGNAVEVPRTDEESLEQARVKIWAQRVPKSVYDRVAADKRDDMIIQDAVLGRKPAWQLQPDFEDALPGGTLTEW